MVKHTLAGDGPGERICNQTASHRPFPLVAQSPSKGRRVRPKQGVDPFEVLEWAPNQPRIPPFQQRGRGLTVRRQGRRNENTTTRRSMATGSEAKHARLVCRAKSSRLVLLVDFLAFIERPNAPATATATGIAMRGDMVRGHRIYITQVVASVSDYALLPLPPCDRRPCHHSFFIRLLFCS
jgi:hypothetical protein